MISKFITTHGEKVLCLRPPNARAQLLPEAGARHERTLEAVGSMPWFGWGHPRGQEVECSLACPILGLSCYLLHRLQKRFTGENHLFPTLDKPPLPDDPLFIDQEEGPLRDRKLGKCGVEGQATILPGDPQVRKVAEQRVGQLK